MKLSTLSPISLKRGFIITLLQYYIYSFNSNGSLTKILASLNEDLIYDIRMNRIFLYKEN